MYLTLMTRKQNPMMRNKNKQHYSTSKLPNQPTVIDSYLNSTNKAIFPFWNDLISLAWHTVHQLHIVVSVWQGRCQMYTPCWFMPSLFNLLVLEMWSSNLSMHATCYNLLITNCTGNNWGVWHDNIYIYIYIGGLIFWNLGCHTIGLDLKEWPKILSAAEF